MLTSRRLLGMTLYILGIAGILGLAKKVEDLFSYNNFMMLLCLNIIWFIGTYYICTHKHNDFKNDMFQWKTLFTFRRSCGFILLLLALLDTIATSIAFQNLVEMSLCNRIISLLLSALFWVVGAYFVFSRKYHSSDVSQ